MTDDLTRMRARKIAREKSPPEIRNELRTLIGMCPVCRVPLREHNDAQLDLCATKQGA